MSSVQTTLTMSSLIEEVLDDLYRVAERPRQVVLAEALDATETAVDVASFSAENLGKTDVVEVDRELMLVTGVAGSTLTVSRGYASSTATTHDNGAVGSANPDYPRIQIDRAIRRFFQSVVTVLPSVDTETYTQSGLLSGSLVVEVPSSVVRVIDVRAFSTDPIHVAKLTGAWQYEDWLPPEVAGTGKAILIPSRYRNYEIAVTYAKPYSWSGAGESATIRLLTGAEDLPVRYAVALLATGREVSRAEFDQVEEWSNFQQGSRNTLRLIQALWGRYYQRLDEAISVQNLPNMRAYRGRMPSR